MALERTTLHAKAATERRPAAAVSTQRKAVAAAPSPGRVMQQRLGNRATQALIARSIAAPAKVSTTDGRAPVSITTPPSIQLSSTTRVPARVSKPNDPAELEAEETARKVTRMPEPPAQSGTAQGRLQLAAAAPSPSMPTVQRRCADCEEEISKRQRADPPVVAGDAAHVHRSASAAEASQVSAPVAASIHNMQGGGAPLPAATRAFFEPRFGANFSRVRVHTGARADSTAKAISAKAFTVGSDIVFADGQYSPESHEGQHLLAHELTHVVQQDGGTRRLNRQADRVDPGIVTATQAPTIQRAWYNFNIPFTDYQFDPSIEGVKTAAGIVKDTAVEALDWIVDQIKGLVNAGLDWLREKWNDLQQLAASAWNAAKEAFTNIIQFFKNPLGFLADAIMNLDADSLSRAWGTFSGLVTSVANNFKGMADSLLSGINKVWGFISGHVTSLLGRLAGITSSFLFKKLPDALQNLAFSVINTLKSLWKAINDGWTRLIGRIKAWVDNAIDVVFSFLGKVLSFGINVVIKGIVQFGQLVLFMKDLFTNPLKYVGMLAPRAVKAFDGVESRFAGVVAQYFGSTRAPARVATAAVKGPAAGATVHRAPGPQAAAEPKTSATWAEIGSGIWEVMGKKWDQFKANPMAVVWGLLRDLIFPIIGNIEDIIKLFKDIYHIVTGPLSAGSLDELWTSLLKILDIPILIYHTVVSILMRTLMVPLIVASFIPHPVVKGIAAAVGYGLLGMFVQVELVNIGHKLLLLKTGKTTGDEKKEAYNRIADSLLAFAMALAIFLFMLLLHFLANVAKGIYNFVKGKVFGIEPAPAKGTVPGEGKGGPKEAKDTKPKTDEPAAKDLGTQNGKKVLAEKKTADGKHEVKVTEEGIRCCSDLCEILIKQIDAHVADNPAVKPKLEPFRKQLETAQGKLESARIAEGRAPPEGKAQAARDVQAAADAAAEVGADLKPKIEAAVREAPLPSGLRFNEHATPEQAMGMGPKEGRARFVDSDPINNQALLEQGYTTREYYLDNNNKKWSIDVRKVNGKDVYKEAKPSSGQEFQ